MNISRREALGWGALVAAAVAMPAGLATASASPAELLAATTAADFAAKVGSRVSIIGAGARAKARLVSVTPVKTSTRAAGSGEVFRLRFRPDSRRAIGQDVYSILGLAGTPLPLLLVPTGDGRDLIATINRWIPATVAGVGEKS